MSAPPTDIRWRGGEGQLWVELSRTTALIRTLTQVCNTPSIHVTAWPPSQIVLSSKLDGDQAVAAEASALTGNIRVRIQAYRLAMSLQISARG